MFWTPELAYSLEDAPWPATKEELIDYANRTGAPQQVVDNLAELEDNDELYEGMEDLWFEGDKRVGFDGIEDKIITLGGLEFDVYRKSMGKSCFEENSLTF